MGGRWGREVDGVGALDDGHVISPSFPSTLHKSSVKHKPIASPPQQLLLPGETHPVVTLRDIIGDQEYTEEVSISCQLVKGQGIAYIFAKKSI